MTTKAVVPTLAIAVLALAGRAVLAAEAEREGDRLVADGPPTALIADADRHRLGLRNGPDSIVDHWHTAQGDFLVFSGLREDGVRGTFRVATDAALQHAKAGGPADLQLVLTPGCARPAAPGQRRAPGTCQDFDSDYAGGGTVFACPGGGPTLYFYHGENHTDPQGGLHQGPESGWTGLGVARWDERTRAFRRVGQVIGMALSNEWGDDPASRRTMQGPPISGNPSAVLAPGGADVYLVFADRGSDGDPAAEAARCAKRTCTAVARAPVAAVCGADERRALGAWTLRHRGRFESPGLLGTRASGPRSATGGPFTPLQERWRNLGETTPNVTWLPARNEYVQVAVANDGQILARHSRDALAWTRPYAIAYAATSNRRVAYARLLVGTDPAHPVLTFVEREAGGWRDAALRRVPLSFRAEPR